jgi:AAA domain
MPTSTATNIDRIDFTGVPRCGPGVREAIEFLRRLRPDGKWQLSAIIPDGGGISTITAQTENEAAAFIDRHNGRRNLYYGVNPLRTAMAKKASKEDIVAAEYVWADCDPADGETPAYAKQRYRSKLNELAAAGLPQPTFIIDSGGGWQILWRLKPRIKFGRGEAEWLGVEGVSQNIMSLLGAKAGTQDVCRILRLPGTQNLPDAKKRAAGRVECRAKLILAADAAHPFEAFPQGERRDHTGADDDEELPEREAFEAALRKWRGTIRAKRRWWRVHLGRRWGSADKSNRSDDLHRMEHDCCELGIPASDCFLLIWPLDICKFRYDRGNGERQLRREIRDVYAEHAKAGDKARKDGESESANAPPVRVNPFRLLSESTERKVKYLWRPLIPAEFVTMVEGQRFQGKSYIVMWVIAQVTRGRSPGFAITNAGNKKTDIEPMRVLYLTKENPSDLVLRPRMRVMGGDVTKILTLDDDPTHDFYDFVFDDEGFKLYEEMVLKFRPGFIAIDALNSFVPAGVNINVANEIKPVIERIGRIGVKVGAPTIIVRHWRKSAGSALDRASGLVDIGAVARSVLVVGCDKDDDDIHHVAHAGLTVGKKGKSLKFHFEGDPDDEDEPARLVWDGESNVTADELAGSGGVSPRDAAKEWLVEFLKDGPKPRDDVYEAAASYGHTQATLRRAAAELKITSERVKGVRHGHYEWKLP